MASVDGLSGVLDTLTGLQPKVQAQIARKLFSLAKVPIPNDAKKLKGYADLLRVDVGEYRVVYRFIEEKDRIEIVLVEKRNDDAVYKKLKGILG